MSGYAGTSDKYSWLKGFNPFAGFMGGGFRYPKWLLDVMGGNESAAATTWNAAASGLLAAALVAGHRALRHADRISNLEDSDNPAKGIDSQLSTTFAGGLGEAKKDLKEDQKKQEKRAYEEGEVHHNPLSIENIFRAAVPTGVTLLAAAAAWKGADTWATDRRNRKLDEAIAAKADAAQKLMTLRARIAKGTASEKDVKNMNRSLSNTDMYVKTASQEKHAAGDGLSNNLMSGIGLILASLAGASAIGAYEWTKANSKNNIRYKAIEKGLKEYAKNKAGLTPISIVPDNASEYFASIDAGQKAIPTRELPAVDETDLNKPISVTI